MSSSPGTFGGVPGSWDWPSDVPGPRHSHQPQPTPTTKPHQSQSTEQTSSRQSTSQGQKKRKNWKPRTCRICLDTVLPTFHPPSEHIPEILQPEPRVTYDSDGGKLVSPCKCKGSQKYVHEECLEKWRLSDPSIRSRTYWECPTCKFKYRFSRLSWGRMIGSVGSQIVLTTVIFLVAIFILGFIADPIINLALDPTGHLFNLWNLFSSRPPAYFPEDEEEGSWAQHFTKGFASLGLLGVIKVMLTSPFQVWFRQAPVAGRGRGPTGRDRIQTTTWLVILIGAATVVYGVWKMVRAWSQRVLERAGDRVIDVHGDDDDDDDDDDD